MTARAPEFRGPVLHFAGVGVLSCALSWIRNGGARDDQPGDGTLVGAGGAVLAHHARRRNRYKRGGDREREPFDVVIDSLRNRSLDAVQFLDLHEALETLEQVDARGARVLDLRFFAGLTIRETADVLGVSAATVESDFRVARAWLRKKLSEKREAGHDA